MAVLNPNEIFFTAFEPNVQKTLLFNIYTRTKNVINK